MSITDARWRAILLGVLEPADTSDVKAIARAAVCGWEKLTSRLIPLLGSYSVYLIYRRSLDLNKSIFPWLPMATRNHSMQAPFTELRLVLERQLGSDIVRANLALLQTFAELLTALIGERLTTLFVRSAFQDNGVPDSEELCE